MAINQKNEYFFAAARPFKFIAALLIYLKNMDELQITFISRYDDDIKAYKQILGDYENIHFVSSDVIKEMQTNKYDAVISPANSFGFMDGGIDAYYLQYFGRNLQTSIQDILKSHYHGELPVGNAIILNMGEQITPQYFIVSPTMREPEDVSRTPNAYLAFKGILEAIERSAINHKIRHILVPCLCLGVGRMPGGRSAWQVKMAYDAFFGIKYGNKGCTSIYDVYDYDNWVGIRHNNTFMKTIK